MEWHDYLSSMIYELTQPGPLYLVKTPDKIFKIMFWPLNRCREADRRGRKVDTERAGMIISIVITLNRLVKQNALWYPGFSDISTSEHA